MLELAIIGAGPAGLAAATFAASEGITTLLIHDGIGGQARLSSRIENYAGFPIGISGSELTSRMCDQARRLGATVHKQHVHSLDEFPAKAYLLALGVQYRTIEAPNCDKFINHGIFYQTGVREAEWCRCGPATVVGGGNSAGQAALWLAGLGKEVYLVVRKSNLVETMSQYLVERIEQTPIITLLLSSEIEAFDGSSQLEQIHIHGQTNCTLNSQACFVMIGAQAHTEWLPQEIIRDKNGFIVTDEQHKITTLPNLWAVGDVRSGSLKRVANAVGEGSIVVADIWRFVKS